MNPNQNTEQNDDRQTPEQTSFQPYSNTPSEPQNTDVAQAEQPTGFTQPQTEESPTSSPEVATTNVTSEADSPKQPAAAVSPQPETEPTTAPVQATAPENAPKDDPGQVLGILGIILGIIITPIIGIILSILSKKKSKEAGLSGKLGKIGIIINAVLLVLGVVVIGLLAITTFYSYSGIQERANESEQRALEQQEEAKRRLELQQQ